MSACLLASFREALRFYLSYTPRELCGARVSFSQFGEDLFLANLFSGQSHGFYVDIGAFHPFRFSNTYGLYRNGWRGINVEPNPDGLRKLVRYRPRDLNLGYAVSTSPGDGWLTVDDTFSALVVPGTATPARAAAAPRVPVRIVTLAGLLDEYLPQCGSPEVDLLTVDCEGHDQMVLQSNDWARFAPRVILVEDHAKPGSPEIDGLLSAQRYRVCCRLGLTRVFLRADAAHLAF